jgi:hypothetical protein
LPGDPIRCPECGTLNSLADLLTKKRFLRRELSNLETRPTICAAGFMILSVLVPFFLNGAYAPCFLIMAAVGLFMVSYGVIGFGMTARWRPGWLRVVCLYQTPLIPWFLMMFSTGILVRGKSGPPISMPRWLSVSVVLLMMASITLIGVLYRRAKKELDVFCRSIAVSRSKSRRAAQTDSPKP